MNRLADALKVYIDSGSLTPEQRDVCYGTPNFVVRACPGSGKTRTTATRFAWRMANWHRRHSGVAVLSFTNIAWKEIGQQLRALGLPSVPPWPHFLGTIDAFVNRHIFLPFGHTVMGCRHRPEIVHDGNRQWVSEHITDRRFGECYRNGCNPTLFEFALGGQLKYRGPRYQPTKCQRLRCNDLKATMVKRGLALYSDAMYWGLKVLENKSIRQAIATRFSEIIVDEAQDTSEVQFQIIEALVDAGAKVVLVGDPDQAIYEFHDARPDLFATFERRWPTLPMSVNFRSSQYICNATHLFSSLGAIPIAAGPHRNCPNRPILRFYAPGSESGLVTWFRSKLDEHGIEAAGAAILARRHELVGRLRGTVTKDWPGRVSLLAKTLAKGAVFRDAGLHADAHDAVMWATLRLCFNRSSYGPCREAIEPVGDRNWRRQTWWLVKKLPPSSTPLADWGPALREVIVEFLNETGWPCESDLARTFCRNNDSAAHESVATFVHPPCSDTGLICKVIHQVKGESYDAVMVVCAAGKRGRESDLEQWMSESAGSAAERRTGYVALTRPRKLLVLAVPEGVGLTGAGYAGLSTMFDACDGSPSDTRAASRT